MSAPLNQTYGNGVGQVSSDAMNTWLQNANYISGLQNFVGLPGMVSNIIGFTVPNDGGQGLFYWNAAGNANDGINNVQPNGAASGCWTRVPAPAGTTTGITYTAPFTGAVTESLNSKLAQAINILDFGAAINTDSTVAIQAALTAAGSGGVVYFPPGEFIISATLNGYPNQTLIGSGPNSTVLYRTGNYGDTFLFGSAAAGCGCVTIQDMWLKHSTSYITGATSIPNLATFGAHIHLIGAQGSVIENVWAWRLPYQVIYDSASFSIINNCNFYGVWDYVNPGCQEGQAQVIYRPYNGAICTEMRVSNTVFNGVASAVRTVTYTPDGGTTRNISESIGSQNMIQVQTCEGLDIRGNYIGGADYFNILFNNTTSPILDVRIIGNFFDAGRDAQIQFGSTANNASGVVIADNIANGESNANTFITCNPSGTSPTLYNFSITGNSTYAHVGTPMILFGASNGVVSGNSIASWNYLNVATDDSSWIAAAYAGQYSANVLFSGNVVGNGAYTYQGIFIQAGLVNVSQVNTMWQGIQVNSVPLSGLVPNSGQTSLLGVLKSANLNTTGDQNIPVILMSGQKYVVTDVWLTNASTSLTTASGGVYTAASKGGTAVVASTQVYSACTNSTTLERATIAAAGLSTTFTTNPLVFSLTTTQGGAATADIYVRGVLLT